MRLLGLRGSIFEPGPFLAHTVNAFGLRFSQIAAAS